MKEKSIQLLRSRGVEISDIVSLVRYLQEPYIADLNDDDIEEDIHEILDKREVYHQIFTGIALDIAVEEDQLFDPEISGIIREDAGLYGTDEVLAYGICNLYGSIALTNFGYIDKVKPGIIGVLNELNEKGHCHTFLDDLVGAIAASAAAKLAHTHKRKELL